MERYKSIKNTLVGIVESQLGNWQCVDAEELGEVVDMIKDMEEAMYYCSIVKAMEKQEKEEKAEEEAMKKLMKNQPHTTMYYTNSNFYPDPRYDRDAYRDLDKENGRMYYSPSQPRDSQGRFTSENSNGSGMRSGGRSSTMYYTERPLPYDLRDTREGRSPMSRRTYMESKELHHGKEKQLKDLEKYMHELSEDITEIIEDATPEEKRVMHEKISHLAGKIKELND